MKHYFAAAILSMISWSLVIASAYAQTLDSELQPVPVGELANSARQLGDATRGAIIFHQPSMACSKCHVVGGDEKLALGPDLSALGNDVSDEALVESVLQPSKTIRKGYESLVVLMTDGSVISGIPVEQNTETIVIRDSSRIGQTVAISVADIEEVKQSELSIMPAGQMNQLTSRQQFYDLIRYLIEIRDGGPQRALQLQPSPSLLVYQLPEYENHLDHAKLINGWDAGSHQRGEAIYQRVCANCHGTLDQLGSLPTSLRFAEGKFKNGSDPYSMYRTLTHGFGQMTPQTWMVPIQKYDVIHYIRETYLRTHNPSQFTEVDANYLATLPKGDTLGPEPRTIEAWSAMDYGPSLTHTYEIPGPQHNFAYKGVAVRLDPGAGGIARGGHWMVFDTDTLRVAAGWHSGDNKNRSNFIDWRAIQFDGAHGVHPRIVGEVAFANATGPGWGRPADGSFVDDQRVLGRDGRPYGPLPNSWGKFKGLYHHDQDVVLLYSVGDTDVLEMPRLLSRENASPMLARTFNIGPRSRDLVLQVAEHASSDVQLQPLSGNIGSGVIVAEQTGGERTGFVRRGTTSQRSNHGPLVAGFSPEHIKAEWILEGSNLRLRIPAGEEPVRFTIWIPATWDKEASIDGTAFTAPTVLNSDMDLQSLTKGGPARWPQRLTTSMRKGGDNAPFSIDVLEAPETNPWLALTRFTGLDFFSDGRLAVCSWDGDVWIVTPRSEGEQTLLDWQRVASGMFQPLGLKILEDKIYLTCRDQLTVLHDLNGDGEIDFYECLNNDHQVTEHFHEFAMGLQTDVDGNFYYAKSGCHGKAAVVPHHGTLLKVAADGSRTEVLANGFRAANGVCLNPDGSFVVTDQEGFWNPKNRINWVTLNEGGKPNFYGNMLGYHDIEDSSDTAMEQPLCWITNDFDRSPAELLWVDSAQWGQLKGSLLNLSYGYGKVYLVPHEEVNGQMQGGMIELPLPTFPTGVMRGRFHPADGQLYLCGMFAWAGSATHPGGLYRIRYNEQPTGLPMELHAYEWGMELKFADEIEAESVSDLKNYAVQAWDLKRTANYGSDHYRQRTWPVTSAELLSDHKTLRLKIPEITPTWGMEIQYRLRGRLGHEFNGKIHNTIHHLRGSAE
ncbi:DUF6797 domain-containing protein [Pirellulaceae bacterium SH449]